MADISVIDSGERHLVEDDVTEKPSPTPTLPQTRILGVGLGIFLLFVTGWFCACCWLDWYHGGTLLNSKIYMKPCNAGVCCLFWYGCVVLYLFTAPREDATEDSSLGKVEYSHQFFA